MEDEKIGCWASVIFITVLLVACILFWLVPHEPLFRVHLGEPWEPAPPNVFHQVILEQAQTENEIKLLTAKHELRKEWAWIAALWAMIAIGGYCFVAAWRKWLKNSH